MNPSAKAFIAVQKYVDFLKRTRSSELHLRAYEEAGRLGVPDKFVVEALTWFARFGGVKLTTWSNRAWREVTFQECPTEDFFYNRDDANHVRLHLAA